MLEDAVSYFFVPAFWFHVRYIHINYTYIMIHIDIYTYIHRSTYVEIEYSVYMYIYVYDYISHVILHDIYIYIKLLSRYILDTFLPFHKFFAPKSFHYMEISQLCPGFICVSLNMDPHCHQASSAPDDISRPIP